MPAISTGPIRRLSRTCTILRTSGCDVLFGCRAGREDRSCIPDSPSWRYRSAHRFAVGQETWNRSAARTTDQPSSANAVSPHGLN